MENLLEGRVAIVTGAGRGIGRAHALSLAKLGARIVVNDLGVEKDGTKPSQTPADEVVEAIEQAGGKAVANYDSVGDWNAAKRIVQTAVEHFGGLDIVVNNAAMTRHIDLIEDMTEEDYDVTLTNNLKGTFAICHHAVPILKERGYGRIINTATNKWTNPTGGAAYAASKGGVVSLTYDLAAELWNSGITVNAIAPFAATRQTENRDQRHAEQMEKGILSTEHLSTLEDRADPMMVSPIVMFLATEHASHVTGCVFRAGNGKIALYTHPSEGKTIFRDSRTKGAWTIEELIELLPRTVLSGDTKPPHIH